MEGSGVVCNHFIENNVYSEADKFKFKGIGLQKLSLNSDDGAWREYHFATKFMKIG